MAIAQGIPFKFRKSLGDITCAKFGDEFVIKQKIIKPATPARYFGQMIQRSKAGNVVNFYNATDGELYEAFELPKNTSNPFTQFNHENLGLEGIYLTKNESKGNAVILYPYCVSSGKLTSIDVSTQGEWQVSSICLGDLVIDENTTVSQLALAIEVNNEGYDDKSRLSFMRATQVTMNGVVEPTVKTRFRRVDLKVNQDNPKLWAMLGKNDGFLSVAVGEQNYLACHLVNDSLVAWTHSQIEDDGSVVACSKQYLQGPTPSLQAKYQSDIALYYAIESYGGVNKENHYSPNHLSWKEFKLRVQAEIAGLTPDSPNNPEEDGTGNTGPTENEGGNGGSGGSGENGGQTPSTVEITVACTPSGGGTPNGSGSYAPGSEAQISITPSLNWNFIQWNDGDTQNPRTITVPSENTTYTATMQLNM